LFLTLYVHFFGFVFLVESFRIVLKLKEYSLRNIVVIEVQDG